MDKFLELAEQVIIYQIRTGWLEMSRLFNEIAATHDITAAIGLTLLTINPEKGTPVTKIAPRMGMEPNSLSRLLNSLEDKGLIFRRPSQSDKRRVYICLTEAGQEKRKMAYNVVFGLHHEFSKDITPEKLEAFFEVMGVIRKKVETLKEDTDRIVFKDLTMKS
ncbi:MAG: MarR family transcriptional regulator [Bacteroidota bacterium]